MNPKIYVTAVLALLVVSQAFVACGHKEEMDRKKPGSSSLGLEGDSKTTKKLTPDQAAIESANLTAKDLAGSDACTAPFEFTTPKEGEDHSLKTLVDKKEGTWHLESVKIWRQVKNLDTGAVSVITAQGAGPMEDVENIETPNGDGQVLCHTAKIEKDGGIFARIAMPNTISRLDGAIGFFRRTAAYAENNIVRVGDVVYQQPASALTYNLNDAPPGQMVAVASRIDAVSENKRVVRRKMTRLITGSQKQPVTDGQTHSTFLLEAAYVASPDGADPVSDEKSASNIPSH